MNPEFLVQIKIGNLTPQTKNEMWWVRESLKVTISCFSHLKPFWREEAFGGN